MPYSQKIDMSDRLRAFSDFEAIAERFRCVGGRYAATMTAFFGIGYGLLVLAVVAALGYWSFTAFESRSFAIAIVAAVITLLLGVWTAKFSFVYPTLFVEFQTRVRFG